MKNKNGIYIIGVDHGYGNIKTANCCFPTGVEGSDAEPTFKNGLLIYQGRYYQIGIGHKEYAAEKVMDEDYYILTLAAIARELSREQITQANVFLAAGLPLSWVAKQRKAFQEYLLQNSAVEFTFRRIEYRIRIVGAAVYPQGFAAIASIVNHFTGSNMLCDIGNGTMNILRPLDSNVDLRQMFTEKYGVQQRVLAIQELNISLIRAQMAQPVFTKEEIVKWISRFKYGNINDKAYQREMIDTFLNSVYVYDDKIVFTYNFRDHAETVTLDEIEFVFCSDVNDCPPPINPRTFTVLGFLLRKNPGDLSDSLGFFLVGFGCNPAPAVLY